MSEAFLGEIRTFAFGRIPTGWFPCDGRLLAMNQYQALYSILGSVYGGDGRTNFALPDLRGRVPLGCNTSSYPRGSKGGEESHALAINEIPGHTHQLAASNAAASTVTAKNNVWASSANRYAPQGNSQMSASALATTGSGAPHPNVQPFAVASYCIAYTGIYPTKE